MIRFFAPVPLDFDQAFRNGDVRAGAYLLGCHLVAESFRARNTDDGVITFHVAPFAELCEVHPVTIRRSARARGSWLDRLRRGGGASA